MNLDNGIISHSSRSGGKGGFSIYKRVTALTEITVEDKDYLKKRFSDINRQNRNCWMHLRSPQMLKKQPISGAGDGF